MATTRIPNDYSRDLGLPLRWQDERSGMLPAAVKAFINAQVEGRYAEVTAEQLGLVREWIEYYVNAPCWEQGDTDKLDRLRKEVQGLKSMVEINKFIFKCMEIGLDPL